MSGGAAKKEFYRDRNGELHVLEPGQENPDDKREREKTDEDRHYEDYLAGKSSGKVRRIGGYSDGIDRAALESSDSFVTDKDGSGIVPYGSSSQTQGERKHAPAKAYNHRNKIKGKPRQAGAGASDSLSDAINTGAGKLQQALDRARAASDDEDGSDGEAAARDAVRLADLAMEAYNTPIPNTQQLDVYGNDLNVPKRERKLRKFLECFAEEVAARQACAAHWPPQGPPPSLPGAKQGPGPP